MCLVDEKRKKMSLGREEQWCSQEQQQHADDVSGTGCGVVFAGGVILGGGGGQA